MNALNGFLNIHKPRGMTSHDVINVVRRAARQIYGVKLKAGHAGTLDPMATGVLIVCVGTATRLSEYVMASTKQYQARVKLGETTDTYDAEGQVVLQADVSDIMREEIEMVLPLFEGDILQLPPMYSAIKQDGRKLYDLARQGLTVEREPRPVTIHALTLTDWQPPEFTLEVTCSAGTYIRSLAYDIGETLGVGAHLTALARTRSGAFRLEQAIDLDTLTQAADWSAWLLKPSVALADWPHLTLDDAALEHIAHGRAVPQESHADEGTLAAAFDSTGELVALVRAFERQWQPYKVFLTEHNAE